MPGVAFVVHLEDLVLHDAEKDVRGPTHELTRAHVVLRTRIASVSGRPPGFAGVAVAV